MLSEERKLKDQTSYCPVQCEKLTYLEKVWCVKTNLKGTYVEDYNTLTSSKTAFKDDYNTTVFRQDECWRGATPLEHFDRQPLPDFKLWEDAGELHYTGYEERRDFPSGPWDESPGIFLPEKVLNICFRVLPTPSQAVMTSVAFLAWVSLDEHQVSSAPYTRNFKTRRRRTCNERPGSCTLCIKKVERHL